MLRHRVAVAFGVLVVSMCPSLVFASPDPSTTTAPLGASPVIDEQGGVPVPDSVASPGPVPSPTTTIPVGCPPPPVSQAVFVGRVKVLDATQAVFEVERLRSGSLAGYSTQATTPLGAEVVDVGIYYGRDVKFLEVDATYLVGTALDPTTGRIFSRVTDEAPMFGGNQIADINNSGVVCPSFDDVARTLNLDGSAVESGVLSGLDGESGRLVFAILVPAGLVVLGLVVLALLRRALRL